MWNLGVCGTEGCVELRGFWCGTEGYVELRGFCVELRDVWNKSEKRLNIMIQRFQKFSV